MNHKYIANVLKIMCIVMALLGVGLYLYLLPYFARGLFEQTTAQLQYCLLYWLTGGPCYYVLVKVWMIADKFTKDEIFTKENAKLFHQIYKATMMDIVYFIAVCIIFLCNGIGNNIIVLGAKAFIVFVGFAFGFVVRVIGEMVNKSAELKEENDLTI